MTRFPRPPLDAEERALAAQLPSVRGRSEPTADMDARILASARAAAPVGGARRPRRWQVPVALAASLCLAVGLAWQLRLAPTRHAQVDSTPAAALHTQPAVAPPPAAEPRPAAQSLPDDARSAESAPPPSQPATPLVGLPAATPVRPLADTDHERAGASVPAAPPPPEPPAPAPASPSAFPAAVESQPVEHAARRALESTTSRDRLSQPAPAPAPAPAPPAPPASPPAAAPVVKSLAAPPRAQAGEAAPAAKPAKRAENALSGQAGASVDAPADDVPPATMDSPSARAAWLHRIAELAQEGRIDDARASLAEFRRRYPNERIPAALRALEHDAPP